MVASRRWPISFDDDRGARTAKRKPDDRHAEAAREGERCAESVRRTAPRARSSRATTAPAAPRPRSSSDTPSTAGQIPPPSQRRARVVEQRHAERLHDEERREEAPRRTAAKRSDNRTRRAHPCRLPGASDRRACDAADVAPSGRQRAPRTSPPAAEACRLRGRIWSVPSRAAIDVRRDPTPASTRPAPRLSRLSTGRHPSVRPSWMRLQLDRRTSQSAIRREQETTCDAGDAAQAPRAASRPLEARLRRSLDHRRRQRRACSAALAPGDRRLQRCAADARALSSPSATATTAKVRPLSARRRRVAGRRRAPGHGPIGRIERDRHVRRCPRRAPMAKAAGSAAECGKRKHGPSL